MTTPNVQPGWYRDPSGQPGQRYHDGQRWTKHFVPTPPPPAPPAPTPAVAVAVSNSGGVNHGLHAVLTLLTCGAWLPIWLIVAIFGGGGGSSSVAIGGAGGVAVSNGGGGSKVALSIFGVFFGLVLLGTAAQHPWLFVVFGIMALVGGGAFYLHKQKPTRDEENQKLAMRADYENDLHADGDPRGIHGRYMPPPSAGDLK